MWWWSIGRRSPRRTKNRSSTRHKEAVLLHYSNRQPLFVWWTTMCVNVFTQLSGDSEMTFPHDAVGLHTYYDAVPTKKCSRSENR